MDDNITTSGNFTVGHSSRSYVSLYLSLAVITLPGLVTNALALYFIIRDLKKAVFPAILLLFVLCIADFTAVVFSAISHFVRRYVTEFSFEMCASFAVLQSFFRIFAGSLNILMACDRLMAICTPFYYRKHIDVRTWKIGCTIAAVSTFTVTLFPLVGLGNVMDTTIVHGVSTNKCSTLSYQTDPIRRVYGVLYGIYGFVVVAAVVFCNTLVVRSVLVLNKRVVSLPSAETSIPVDSNDVRNAKNVTSFEVVFAKLMGGLAVVYIVCGTPYSTLVLMQQANMKVKPAVTGIIHMLAGLAYTVDPIVYILMRKANRRFIFNLVCKCRADDEA